MSLYKTTNNMGNILNLMLNFLRYELYGGANVKITVGTIVFAIIVFFVTFLMIKFLKKMTVRVFSKKNNTDDHARIDTIFNFIGYFIYIIVFFSILSAIGVNINMFLTATAALFVGLGFALQQIFQDLIAGIYILLDRTLNVGDIIQVDGKVSKVKGINLRSTIVETRDHRVIVIPNRIFINENVHNWTQDQNVIRAQVELRVHIGTDVQLVRQILLQSVQHIPEVLHEPIPTVILDEFGESFIHFNLRYFVDDAFSNDRIASDIRFEIDRLFKENGIQLAVPVLKIKQ